MVRLAVRLVGLIFFTLFVGACQGGDPAGGRSGDPAATAPGAAAVSSLLERADEAFTQGRLPDALAGYSAASSTDPASLRARIGLASTHAALGDLDKAERHFQAIQRDPAARSPEVDFGLGRIALKRGRAGDAARSFRAAVDADPSLWRAWIGLGRSELLIGNDAGARRAFAGARRHAPARAIVANDIGVSYLARNDAEEAARHFEEALTFDRGFALARSNLRIARAMQREYDMAVAGAGPSELADALNNVGYVAILNRDFAVADRLLRRALETSPIYHEAARANLELLAQAQDGRSPGATAAFAEPGPRLARRETPDALAVAATANPRGERAATPRAAAGAASPDVRAATGAARSRARVPETAVSFRWETPPQAPEPAAQQRSGRKKQRRSRPGDIEFRWVE